MSICHFSRRCVEIIFQIFTQNKMKRKRTDGESAKAVREQVFLSRHKSVPGIVDSSDSKFSAYCQCCCSSPWSVDKNWPNINFSENTVVVFKVYCYLYSRVNGSGGVLGSFLNVSAESILPCWWSVPPRWWFSVISLANALIIVSLGRRQAGITPFCSSVSCQTETRTLSL